jgi:hypothetical protein
MNRIAIALLLATVSFAQAARASPAETDHARLLRLLDIDTLRPGAHWDPAEPNAANYDESAANEDLDSLPDPLVDDSGRAVATAAAWWGSRRAEIQEHFDRALYGRVPNDVPAIEWSADDPVPGTLGDVAVVSQTVTGTVAHRDYPAVVVEIALQVTLPRDADEPVPAVLQLAFDPEFLQAVRARVSDAEWLALVGDGPPWQQQVVDRGWAAIELVATSVQADNGEGLAAGIIGLSNRGQPRDLDDWGALRAWAWGASRVLDYLSTRADIDENRVAVHGHSRFGKAALLAMAYDTRFAAAFISSSGAGGAKLWRRNFGEQIGNVAGAGEYHWMAGNFLRYAGPLSASDLPVDAHSLIALCAPRPVFISSGAEGELWIDPKGMFLAAVHAGPVYELLGARGLGTMEMPAVGVGLLRGELAWRQHEKGHTPGPNWPWFLDFAARYFDNAKE